jgi:lipopolysaccharide biosynthesis glycosyltransferase
MLQGRARMFESSPVPELSWQVKSIATISRMASDRARMPVDVAIMFDRMALDSAVVAVTSMLAHASPGREYRIHAFCRQPDPQLYEPFRALQRRRFTIIHHDMDAESADLTPEGWPRAMTFQRLLLPDLLPDVERLLYLDVDLVVCRDIGELFDTDLNDKPLGACVDLPMRWRMERGRRPPVNVFDGTVADYLDSVLKLPVAARPNYFNAGVILFDLDRMRELDLKRRAFEFWSREKHHLWNFDQCVLNALFGADYKIFDPKWNAMTPVARHRLVREIVLRDSDPSRLQLAALSHPAILHFASNKPWNHSNRPRAGLWWAAALASPSAGRIVSAFMRQTKLSVRSFYTLLLAPFQILREAPTFVWTKFRINQSPDKDASNEQRMTIYHLDTGRTLRGGQLQVLNLMHGLKARGHSVKLLARRDGMLLQRAKAEGLDAEPISLLSLARGARRADLVHAHDSRSHSYAALVGGVPIVVSRRVAFAAGQSLLSRVKYRRAKHYIAVSRFVADKLKLAGIEDSRISVVYDGVAIPQLQPDTVRNAIVAPATDDPAKGSDILHEAVQGMNLPILFSDDLLRDMPRASLFLYLSRSEGLGSAAVLAAAFGTPVIASNVGGLPEAVLDEQTGLLVENNPRAIAAAIQRLKTDEPLRQRLSAAARERAIREFSIDRMVEGTLAIYRSCLLTPAAASHAR